MSRFPVDDVQKEWSAERWKDINKTWIKKIYIKHPEELAKLLPDLLDDNNDEKNDTIKAIENIEKAYKKKNVNKHTSISGRSK